MHPAGQGGVGQPVLLLRQRPLRHRVGMHRRVVFHVDAEGSDVLLVGDHGKVVIAGVRDAADHMLGPQRFPLGALENRELDDAELFQRPARDRTPVAELTFGALPLVRDQFPLRGQQGRGRIVPDTLRDTRLGQHPRNRGTRPVRRQARPIRPVFDATLGLVGALGLGQLRVQSVVTIGTADQCVQFGQPLGDLNRSLVSRRVGYRLGSASLEERHRVFANASALGQVRSEDVAEFGAQGVPLATKLLQCR
ncbi:hypothetical protein GCM10023319_24150 [Nocardia iowensis]